MEDIRTKIAEEIDGMIGGLINEKINCIAVKYKLEGWEILNIYKDYLIFKTLVGNETSRESL